MSRVEFICHNLESVSNIIKNMTRFNENQNKFVIEAAINYIKNFERFSGPIFE